MTSSTRASGSEIALAHDGCDIGQEGTKECEKIGTVDDGKDGGGSKYVHRCYLLLETFIVFCSA